MCGPETTPLAKASAVTRGGILCFRIIRLRLKRGCKLWGLKSQLRYGCVQLRTGEDALLLLKRGLEVRGKKGFA